MKAPTEEDKSDARLFFDPSHPDALIELAERDGRDSMAGKLKSAEWIAGQASVTLTVLLAGVGGSLAYGARVLDPGRVSPIALGAAVLCVYLAVLAALLIWRCMTVDPFPAQVNEPRQWLHSPGMELADLRRQSLMNLQSRIAEARSINDRKANALNNVRLAATVSPLVFALVAGAVSATQSAEGESRPAHGQAGACHAARDQAAALVPGQGQGQGGSGR